MTSLIVGAGGKAGGGSGGLSEEPDTLSSVAVARFVDVIAEGQIGGLVNNEYSIYLDGVPLKNLSGTMNYRPFKWDQRVGLQSQSVIPGFAGTQQEIAVGLKVMKVATVTRSIPDADADSVRVTVAVQGLTTTSSNGNVAGGEVAYKIWVRVAAGAWVPAYDGKITGKTNSRYQRSHEIPLGGLGAGPYEVQVERVTDDSISALVVNDLYWDSYAIINYEQLTYPNSALIAVEIDARYFSQVPTRAYHVRGMLIKVPTNYDPVTRTYATTGAGTTNGAWDGTFKVAYSNNPAWCFYDLVTSTRYGLGNRISASQVDKWTLYQIGKYCDGLVATGLTSNVFDSTTSPYYSSNGQASAGIPTYTGKFEPRFTLNVVINTREDAYRVLNQLASSFRGMLYWSSGAVTMSQDKPGTATMLFTNANVVDGMFNYEGSARSQRNTAAMVGWNDPEENFKQKFEYVEDRDGIARYGVKVEEIVAFGCTSRSQARRVGLWLLYTERMEKDAVSFTTGLDAAMLAPGSLVQIMDTHRAGARWGGRVTASTTAAITLDSAITLNAGTYTLSVMARDGTITSKTVVIGTTASYSTLTPTVAFTTAPMPMAVWTLASTTVTPMTARVIGIKQDGETKFEITCIESNQSKYAAIETGAGITPTNYSFLSFSSVSSVTGLTAIEITHKLTVTSQPIIQLDIDWDNVVDPMVRGYRVKLEGADKTIINLPEQTESRITVSNLTPQSYTVSVVAVNHIGISSAETSIVKVVTGIDSTPPAAVSAASFTYTVDNVAGVRLSWAEIADYIDFYEVRVGANWDAGTLVGQAKANSLLVGVLAAGTYTYHIKAVDTGGNYSASSVSTTVTITAPIAPTIGYAISGTDEVLTWSIPAAQYAIDRYEVRYGASWGAGTVVDTTKATTLRRKVDYSGARKYWVAAIDSSGTVGTPAFTDVTIVAPGTVTGGRVEVVDNNVLLFWAAPSTGSLPVDRYEVRKGASWASPTAVLGSNAASTFTTVFEQSSGTYTYWIAAYDSAGNLGTPVSILATVAQPPDYILRTSVDSVFAVAAPSYAVTLTNMALSGGKVVGPINTSETFAEHFAKGNLYTTYAEDISNAVWSKSNTSVDSSLNLGADGRTVARKLVESTDTVNTTHTLGRSVTIVANSNYTFTVRLKAAGRSKATVYYGMSGTPFTRIAMTVDLSNGTFVNADVGTPTSVVARTVTDLGSGWYEIRLSGIFDTTSTTGYVEIRLSNGTTTSYIGNGTNGILVQWGKLEAGSSPTPFWPSPQNQVDAGYALYANPSLASGTYDESFDYGSALSATVITATLGTTLVQGSVTVACQLYYKLNLGDAWTAATAGVTSFLASNFRYVRVVYTFSCTAGANLIQMDSLNVKLAAKLKTDSGVGTISNATNGVVVNFNLSFVDADTPIVQPMGTTPLIPVVDFTDSPNPTSFTVYLYGLDGLKKTGSFSWTARGY